VSSGYREMSQAFDRLAGEEPASTHGYHRLIEAVH